ncbi:MAG: murein biosynthesis integral membrane protein MurJ [Parachlamydiales bacterium]|jgi:putative peptidoglycan lipid II flippase
MTIDATASIIRSFKNFFLGTVFSRISGFFRDIALAFFFGASPFIASFMVAFRFAYLFRRLFGETSFQNTFIPHYESLKIEDSKKASVFYRDLFFSLIAILAIVIFFSEIILFVISKFVAESLIINLTQIMLFGLFFICLYALNSSFLQCHSSYFLASVAPVAFNVIWIVTIFLFRNMAGERFVYVLSIGIVLAFLFQYLTTAFSSYKIISNDLTSKEMLKPKLFSEDIKKLIKPIFLSIIGIGAVQINSALDALFGAWAQKEGPAYLWYSIRLYQVPLALFGIALSAAILPPLVRAYKNEDLASFSKFLNIGLTRTFALMMPCTIGTLILGPSVVNLIYTRGAFGLNDLINTTYCLFGYILGLSFSAFVMILSQAYFAKKQYFIPMIASVFSVVLNVILNSVFIFIFDMKSISIAIATSVSSVFNFYLLWHFLRKPNESVFRKEHLLGFFKISITSVMAGLITILAGILVKDQSIMFLLSKDYFFPGNFMSKLGSFSFLGCTYFLSILSIAYAFKIQEILDLIKRKRPNL